MSPDAAYDPFAADPFPAYEGLRTHCPVHHYPDFADGFYSLSRYEDVVDVFKNLERWSADEGQGPLRTVEGGLRSDPPEHTVYRRLITPTFSAKRTAALEPFITDAANQLIDSFEGAGKADLIADFAALLPVIVISQILGIPPADRAEFRRLSNNFIACQGSDDVAALDAAKHAIYAVFAREIRSRRAQLEAAAGDAEGLPDDLLSSLVVATNEGRHFSEEELHPLLVLLLVGGIETTTSLIGNLVRRLLEQGTWEATTTTSEQISPAIEESLRFDPPVLGLFRTARHDLQLHGVDIAEGAKVAGLFAAANRDPHVWSDPDRFDAARSRLELRQHLSFGVGIWLCPGAALARLEASVALRAFARRLPHLRLDGAPRQRANFLLWGPQRLNVAWDI